MNSLARNSDEKSEIKAKIIGLLEQNGIPYNLFGCNGNEKLCIGFGSEQPCCNNCCNFGLTILTSGKDVCRIYPHKILYIAIEDRKSVLYLTDRKIETNYRLDYWKDILDHEIFVQPHHSFIVNLNYVNEVTKDFVMVKYGDTVYPVYTSSRKVAAFKKAFLKFGER